MEKLIRASSAHPVMSARRSYVKRARRCLVEMTPSEQDLYERLIAAKVDVCKCHFSFLNAVKLKKVKELYSNSTFLTLMEKWSSSKKLISLLTLRGMTVKKENYKFSTLQKIAAMVLLKQSPRAYRFFRVIFTLPAPTTLHKLFKKFSPMPGIHKEISKRLKLEFATVTRRNKICALVFDEVELKAGVRYHKKKNMLSGLVTNGLETKRVLADHAQVYMIRGIVRNFRLPVAYTLTCGPIKGHELAKQLTQIITQLQGIGFHVVATVCDGATNNKHALKILKDESKKKYESKNEILKENIVIINSKEIVPIFDPPHLLKEVRNNLLVKDLQYTLTERSGMAKWDHIQLFYKNMPTFSGTKLIEALTDKHIEPSDAEMSQSMYAIQVFSHRVFAYMANFSNMNLLPPECIETAYLLGFFNELFDSVNGSFRNEKKEDNPMLRAVTRRSAHRKTWTKAKNALATMQFVEKDGRHVITPTFENWITTIEGIEILATKLEAEYGIRSMWPRYLNMDPLVSFLGRVTRGRDTKPTVWEFQKDFAESLTSHWPKLRRFKSSFGALLVDFLMRPKEELTLTISSSEGSTTMSSSEESS